MEVNMGGVGEREAEGKIMVSFCKAFFFLKRLCLRKRLSYFCNRLGVQVIRVLVFLSLDGCFHLIP